MKLNFILSYIFFVISGLNILLISSCEKSDSDTSSATSDKVSLVSRVYTIDSWGYSSPYYYKNLSLPELTNSNINTTAVLAYFSVDGANWFAIPYIQYDSPDNYYMNYSCNSGNIQVTWFYDSSLSKGSSPNEYYSCNLKIKIIIIPPSGQKTIKKINTKNYREVKEAFQLKD